jgi:purine-binding chemotaxis protein CheW
LFQKTSQARHEQRAPVICFDKVDEESSGMSTAIASPASAASQAHAKASVEFISFAIDGDQYGVDIMAVQEIKGWSGVTRLPRQPDYMRGVLNLRGVMVPIIDLRCRFSQGLTDATPTHIVIIVQVQGKTAGLLADRVLDIISVDASQIQSVPRLSRDGRTDFLSGLVTVEDAMVALIDLGRLVADQIDEEGAATNPLVPQQATGG